MNVFHLRIETVYNSNNFKCQNEFFETIALCVWKIQCIYIHTNNNFIISNKNLLLMDTERLV